MAGQPHSTSADILAVGGARGECARRCRGPDRALRWLDNNAQYPLARQVLAPLVANAPADVAIRNRALGWLDNNTQDPQAYQMLAALVASAPTDVTITHRALRWLHSNDQCPQVYHVLAALVKNAPTDVAIRERALAWLDTNLQHPHAYQVLAALVASAPANVAIRHRALDWLDRNARCPQARQVLPALVASAPADVAIRERALNWLDNNAQHPQVYQVLAVLVANAPANVVIRARALNWLDNNAQHPHLAQLLRVMIARSPDDEAEEWIRKGVEYISVPERTEWASILAVTLDRSKARHDLIDRALALVALPAFKRHRGQVALAIAKGVLRYSARLPDLVATLEGRSPEVIFMVLGQCIRIRVGTHEFLTYLAKALNRGFRKPGYGAILRTLRDYPIVWRDIEPNVSAAIKDDFARTSERARR